MHGWVGSRVGVDVLEKRKISGPCRESDHDFPVVQPVV
jgi:hypothetical protein